MKSSPPKHNPFDISRPSTLFSKTELAHMNKNAVKTSTKFKEFPMYSKAVMQKGRP